MFVNGFVNLYTADIEAGLRFYRDLLGFEETFRTPKRRHSGARRAQAQRLRDRAGAVEAARRVHAVDPSPGTPAMVVVVWADDVDAAFERLRSAGVPVVQPLHDTGNDYRNALLWDPDGNLVEIVGKRA